jgi:phage baseplate assembly protein W
VSTVDTPHFDLPFKLTHTGANSVEQDSIDDVANCVEAIVSCPIGWRDEVPTFGVEDPVMMKQPIGANELANEIASQEPRALVIVEENPDLLDELLDRINIGVSTVRPESE